ncbi:hypothetical protein [Nocardioides daeguensis]|uniref:Diacylglycerol O-acyltransferase n=1 Tax=Nocardioides daeguensis TaxID=908359 RepID=A0ABP6USH2_9ACTN|nr:hypothetical protein [Nocardioides daeguensis]MBV6725624.1 hypothetical protein [Nocardioides daeguensis]MCR1772861.1 hypothetical protein [Nocardioides daeguensis]
MSRPADRAWVADRRIGWRILLTASLGEAVPTVELAGRLAALTRSEGWTSRPPLTAPTLGQLREALAGSSPEPLLVGVHGRDVVLSAHHSVVDGLGLLVVLERLGLGPATSTARGVGDRATTGGLAATVARRLGEVAFHPPAGVTPPTVSGPRAGDALVEAELAGTVRAARLVHAAARAVVRHEAVQGRNARHVAIAVGAVRGQQTAGDGQQLGDHSVLLRLRDVERLDLAEVGQALRTAPVVTPPTPAGERPWSRLTAGMASVGLRLLAPRLGSTLLVSHLGDVTAPHLDRLAFHPVTAGGSGISLGAVGHRGRTVLTLRARAAQWNDNGLEQLLEAVVSLLAEEP